MSHSPVFFFLAAATFSFTVTNFVPCMLPPMPRGKHPVFWGCALCKKHPSLGAGKSWVMLVIFGTVWLKLAYAWCLRCQEASMQSLGCGVYTQPFFALACEKWVVSLLGSRIFPKCLGYSKGFNEVAVISGCVTCADQLDPPCPSMPQCPLSTSSIALPCFLHSFHFPPLSSSTVAFHFARHSCLLSVFAEASHGRSQVFAKWHMFIWGTACQAHLLLICG